MTLTEQSEQQQDDVLTVAKVVSAADALWPFHTQESWDASELIVGRPNASVRRIMVAVDPVNSVVQEAVENSIDLLVVHHPLMLGGQTSVAANTYKGRLVHELIEHRIALLACHTNADSARCGVSEILIQACGVSSSVPLQRLEQDPEVGLGRIGTLDTPVTLEQLAQRLAQVVPPTAQGVRVAGLAGEMIHKVAVCGGAGGSLMETAAAAGADVYVTADLRHHPVSEAREAAVYGSAAAGLSLIDLSHAASEWLWVPQAVQQLRQKLQQQSYAVEVIASSCRTDPWDFHVPSPHPHERWA